MSLKHIARELRRNQTDEEKELWSALRGRRFAGFKFRQQHKVGGHILNFYCADARLAVELDGFQHGLPEGMKRDEPHPNPLPVWRGEGIGAPGGSRSLPKLFSAAGCKFEFGAKTIQPLAKPLRAELEKL